MPLRRCGGKWIAQSESGPDETFSTYKILFILSIKKNIHTDHHTSDRAAVQRLFCSDRRVCVRLISI
jgi:hypothetical protein